MHDSAVPITHPEIANDVVASNPRRPVTAHSVRRALSAYLAQLLRTAGEYFAAGGPLS